MEVRPEVLYLILGAALVTALPRILPLVLLSRIALPDGLVRWLGFVPIAVLAGLLAQSVIMPDGTIALPPSNLYILAIIPTLLVAARTRSLIGTVLVGVVAMALLRFFFP